MGRTAKHDARIPGFGRSWAGLAAQSLISLGIGGGLVPLTAGCRSGMPQLVKSAFITDSIDLLASEDAVEFPVAVPDGDPRKNEEIVRTMDLNAVQRASIEVPVEGDRQPFATVTLAVPHRLAATQLPDLDPPEIIATPMPSGDPVNRDLSIADIIAGQARAKGQDNANSDKSEGSDEGDADRDVVELTLNVAIAQTLARDPVLRSGFQEIAAANADFVTSSLKPNPELEIMQTLLPLVRPFREDVNEGGPPQFDVMLAYPIDWYLFGKRTAAMRSSAAEVRVSRAEYENLVRQRVLEVAEAYYDVMESQALVVLTRQDAENLLTVEQVTKVAVDNGALPRVELNRIRLDRLNSEQASREAQRDLRSAKGVLRAVMGGYIPGVTPPDADGPVEADFRVTDLVSKIEDRDEDDPALTQLLNDLDQVFNLALANRPDIRALNLRIAQTRAEMELQRREAYPEVTPMMGYTRQFQRRAIGQPDADSWGAGVAMTLPVNDRNQGNRLLAAAQWRQSNQELRVGVLELQAEVLSVAADLETALVNSKAIAGDQLRLAEEVRDSIRSAYEAGGRPLIDVLDSQRNYRETFGNYISSRADYLRAVQRFNATVGTQVIP